MEVKYEDWHFKPIKAFTLKDALDCMVEGFICICSNGMIPCTLR